MAGNNGTKVYIYNLTATVSASNNDNNNNNNNNKAIAMMRRKSPRSENIYLIENHCQANISK